MGYHDLESFNMALLGKQGWCLIQNPKALVTRILKEKYFSDVSSLYSSIGRNPLYAWRSIWNVKNILLVGLVWKVGDGNSIKIWKDRWLSIQTFYIRFHLD